MTTTTKPASLSEVHRFFAGDDKDYNLAIFRKDWAGLSDKDKTQLREGIGNSTLTY